MRIWTEKKGYAVLAGGVLGLGVGLIVLSASIVNAQGGRKQSVYDQIAADEARQRQVAAQPVPSFTSGVMPQPTIDLSAKYPQGIIATHQASLPSSTYVIENMYQVVRGGVVVQVYAGGLRTNLDQGFLFVEVIDPNGIGTSLRPGEFLVPGTSGVVHLDAASGDRLTFSTAKGAHGVFDIGAQAFSTP